MIKTFLPSNTACWSFVVVYNDLKIRTLTTNRHIMFSMLYIPREWTTKPQQPDTHYLVTIPLLKALMIIEVRRASILNGGPQLSQSLTGGHSGSAHRFKPVRLLCRVKLRIHVKHKSATTAQPKVSEASHCTSEFSIEIGWHSNMLSGDEPCIWATVLR